MKIVYLDQDNAVSLKGTAVALGFFDGVHRGHAELLRRTVMESKRLGLIPSVLTFSDKESQGLKGDPLLLTEEKTRLAYMEALGIECVFLMYYTDVHDMSGADFAEQLLITRCNAKMAVCGYNFRCGRNAEWGERELGKYLDRRRVRLDVMPPYRYQNVSVSSAEIRERIADGDLRRANVLMGRNFSFSAPVCEGHHLGTKLGFPTANQAYPLRLVCPKRGVYATRVTVEGVSYPAVTNVGVRPTVSEEEILWCESHLLDRTEDLYGKEMQVEFLSFLREEERFEDLEQLKRQIAEDIERAKAYE